MSTTAKDTIELYNDAIKKTVEIRCSNAEDKTGYATGCVVSDDGEILTNKHVVFSDDAFFDKIEVRFYNSDNYIPAVIAKISETDDLALLKIDEPTKDCFLIGRTVAGGEKVYTIGNPNGYGLSFSEGVVSSPLRYVKYKGEGLSLPLKSFQVYPGSYDILSDDSKWSRLSTCISTIYSADRTCQAREFAFDDYRIAVCSVLATEPNIHRLSTESLLGII